MALNSQCQPTTSSTQAQVTNIDNTAEKQLNDLPRIDGPPSS